MEPITSWIEMFLCAGSTILFIAKYSGSHQWWTPPLMFCSDFDEVFQKIFFAELFCNYDLYKIDFETSFGTGFRNSHYCLGQGVYSLQSNNFSSSTVTGSKKARGRRKRISPPPHYQSLKDTKTSIMIVENDGLYGVTVETQTRPQLFPSPVS